jgi:hydroxyethylthiazole kinase-like uncharacterized protein yjeF
MQPVSSDFRLPLYGVVATRRLEQHAAARLAPHTLMQRAGLAVAELALALAPHQRRFWVACGPGNNGGDGLEAAMHLHQWGKDVVVTWLKAPNQADVPADTLASLVRARSAGVCFSNAVPENFDFAIDALLGLGARPKPRPADALTDPLLQWLDLLRSTDKPVLAVDLPSGLDADSGMFFGPYPGTHDAGSSKLGARYTLSLLTVKPGLLTAHGRDLSGQLWWDDLGVQMPAGEIPDAWLLGKDRICNSGRAHAAHASHKGSFGDVAVVGGESRRDDGSDARTHMVGAALLAARAALHAGAGRVFVALLGDEAITMDPQQPELMFRSLDLLDIKNQVLVCGCGGGESVAKVLPRLLSVAPRMVLDADALNAITGDSALQTLLRARHGRGYDTVLTPHPLEAARLLGSSTAQVQANRLQAATQLADQFQCVLVLKGSGTVIAAPGQIPAINSSGNAHLATAGTGDFLAGMLGARMAGGQSAFAAACSAVFQHGQRADDWAKNQPGQPLTASVLAQYHQADLQQQQQHQGR